jgi:hypothetical protein
MVRYEESAWVNHLFVAVDGEEAVWSRRGCWIFFAMFSLRDDFFSAISSWIKIRSSVILYCTRQNMIFCLHL